MATIPSQITVPVKVEPQVAWGKTSTAGASLAVSGAAGAVLAFILGDRSPETMAAIVGGTVTALVAGVTTLAGRYLQAHAAVKGKLQEAAGGVALAAQYVQPLASGIAGGEPYVGSAMQAELAALQKGIVGRVVEALDDRLAPQSGGVDGAAGSDLNGIDDEAETTVLDAVGEPEPINVRPVLKDPEALGADAPAREA